MIPESNALERETLTSGCSSVRKPVKLCRNDSVRQPVKARKL